MYVNLETGAQVWLVAHEHDVHFSTLAPGPTAPAKKNVYALGSYEFFSTHREATRAEIDALTRKLDPEPAPKPSTENNKGTAAPAPHPQGGARGQAAGSPTAGGEPQKAPAKAGGEPHGE